MSDDDGYEVHDPTSELNDQQRAGIEAFLKMRNDPGLQAQRDQLERMGADLFDQTLDMYIDGHELAMAGNHVGAAVQSAKFWAWITGLDEQERYQLINMLVKQLLAITMLHAEVDNLVDLRNKVRDELEEIEAEEGLPPL